MKSRASRRGDASRGVGERARTSICICAAARWASALAPDCAPASTERYCCTLAIADPTAVGDGGDSDADPPAHATQLCAARRWVRTVRGACPRRMRRPGRTCAVSRGPRPSLRVLSPPQLATRFVRRHKARRRPSVASYYASKPWDRTLGATTRRTCPTGSLQPSKNWQKARHREKQVGTHGQICGLFPHVFRHHQHSEGVRILTRLQLVRWQVGRENCPFRLARAPPRSLLDTRGTQRQVLWTKNPTFLT